METCQEYNFFEKGIETEGYEMRSLNKLERVRAEYPGGEMFVTAEEKKMVKYKPKLKKFKKDLKRMADEYDFEAFIQ